MRNQTRLTLLCWALSVAIVLLIAHLGLSSRWLQLIALIAINTLLAQSMNLLGGYTGQISLGHAGLYAAGAYGSAVLSMKYGWPVWLSVPTAVLLAAAIGFLVAYPAKRVKEFYLGMVTLGFGIVAFEVLQYWTPVTGGFMGLSNIPSPVLNNLVVFGFRLSTASYVLVIVTLVAVASWMLANLVKSYVGRSFLAVESSDIVASTLGIRPGRTKHDAYVVSAAWAGLAGALYAHLSAFVSPESFNLWASVTILVMAVFGGLRTFLGPFLGAAFITLLPEFTQGLEQYQYLVYGLILMFSYAALPRGIAGLVAPRSGYIDAEMGAASPRQPPAREQSPASAVPIMQVSGLKMDFGGIRALDGVDMAVRAGTIHGLIGPNGSGKSTIVNVASGIYQPTAGTVLYRDRPIQGLSAPAVAALGLTRTFQNPQQFGDMTVRESVLAGAYLQYRSTLLGCLVRTPGAAAEEAERLAETDWLIERCGLARWRDEQVGNLPYGQRRVAEIARSLNTRPDVLILDEPAAGLSEAELGALAELLRDLKAQGLTILLIEHNLDFLFRLVDEVTVLHHGKVIFRGTPQDSRRSAVVVESYLGTYGTA